MGNVLEAEMKGVPGRATLYDVRGIGAPYHIRLPDKSEKLKKLPKPIGVQIHRLKDKIVTDATGRAWVTHLCDTAAQVTSEGALEAWEDLRLILLDDNQEPTPGHIYGKVTRVTPLKDGRFEVLVSFTSVPAEIYRTFRPDPGGGVSPGAMRGDRATAGAGSGYPFQFDVSGGGPDYSSAGEAVLSLLPLFRAARPGRYRPRPIREIAAVFLHLGCTAFGGLAMLEPMRRRVVEKQNWLQPQEFLDGLALCQMLPGATVVQMAAYAGYRLRRTPGALTAAAGFVLPAFVLMTGLSYLYFHYGAVPWVKAVSRGLNAMVIALLLQALWAVWPVPGPGVAGMARCLPDLSGLGPAGLTTSWCFWAPDFSGWPWRGAGERGTILPTGESTRPNTAPAPGRLVAPGRGRAGNGEPPGGGVEPLGP